MAIEAESEPFVGPEITGMARCALLWVLWHHQGANSEAGQPIRFALGMGRTDRLNAAQVSDAKRYGAMQDAVRELRRLRCEA